MKSIEEMMNKFARASGKEIVILSEEEFYLIRRIIDDLKLIRNGVAAAGYEAQVFEQIDTQIDGDHTKDYLLKLSKTLG